MDQQEDGQLHRACIMEFIQDHDHAFKCQMTIISLGCISINDYEYEKIITYNKLMDFIKKKKENDDIVWRFQGPLIHTNPNCKGS
jgi:hypothetical protein